MPTPLEIIQSKKIQSANPSARNRPSAAVLADSSSSILTSGGAIAVDRTGRSITSGGDSCLPPGDRLPRDTHAAACHASASPDPQADPLPGVPAVACPACGCPAVWMDGMGDQNDQGGQSDAGAALTAHLHCGGCEPPPAMSLATRWFLVVRIENENVAAGGGNRDGGGGGNGSGIAGAGWQSLWEEWRPKFNLAKKRKMKR